MTTATRPRPRPALSPVHRRRRAVAVLVLVLALLGGLAAVPEAEVLTAAAVVPGGPLADVDTRAVAQRVAALPGVAEVTVGRAWPDAVSVAVTERVPVAVVATGRGDMPIDAEGVVHPAPVPPGLPRLELRAPGPDDPATRAVLDVLAALGDPLRAQVVTATSTTGSGSAPMVVLGLTEGREARFGTAERVAEKAAVLLVLLSQEGRVYDVSSPDLPTVRS
jgi:cell division protein FtsQ